jgi:uncharacterized protein (DUF433 family)
MALLETLVAEPAPFRADDDGVIRIGGTRVTLDSVIGAFNNGCAAEEIALKYPSVQLNDVYATITYYLWHQDEVAGYLSQRVQIAEQIRRVNEARFPPQGVRDRLLARRPAKD